MTCANCGKSNSGGMCAWCGHVAEAPRPSEAEVASLTRRLEQRHGVPALLSFFVPGLGQLIKGNVGTALTVWLGIGVFIGVGAAGLWLAFLGIPILWIWSLSDAYVAPDGQARREMDRIAKTMVVLMALALASAGCGSVTARSDEDGGTGGVAGKEGVESGAGGQDGGSSATGGAASAGGSGGAQAGGGVGGTAGYQATGGSGAAGVNGTGGNPCSLGDTLCSDGACATASSVTNCGTCGNACTGGAACFNGTCTCGSITQSFCSGLCVDITTTNNCGSCGNKCATGHGCSNGHCS